MTNYLTPVLNFVILFNHMTFNENVYNASSITNSSNLLINKFYTDKPNDY